ncbi:MAG: hypothetical protein JST87_15670 [Bacteroidetes bacterium]|nr:hypothetical protein [Bacteroidota bacterium]
MFANKNIDWALWLSRVLRWGLGSVMIWLGLNNGEWITAIFGLLLFLTGFLKPRRCNT